MGCHGKKYNKNGVQICSAVDEKGATSDCIGCHMPKFPGGTTKLNKRGREEAASRGARKPPPHSTCRKRSRHKRKHYL